jgi:hypothetical protein
VAWLGLGAFIAVGLIVAGTGMRGGGMLFCRACSECLSIDGAAGWLPLLELLRFHEMLSFLLKELIDEGVGGSSAVEGGVGDLVVVLVSFRARGPVGFCCDLLATEVSIVIG